MRFAPAVMAAVLVTAACSSNSGGHSGSPSATTSPTPPGSATSSGVPTVVGTSRAPTTTPPAHTTSGRAADGLPRPAHVVVVVLENHSYDEIARSPGAPFIQSLVRTGAVLTGFYAITHPSEPNYMALFSGSTQGVHGDPCPVTSAAGNLGHSLLTADLGFAGYAENLPSAGFTGCTSGEYVRRHAPWVNFTDLPGSVSRPMSGFPRDFNRLPTVSFVIPNLVHDMHDGPLPQADSWLGQHLATYVSWARTHNSLFVLTADEDDKSAGNRIATIIAGAHVRAGSYGKRLDHYSLLRMIEEMYHLPLLGHSASAARMTGMWE